jgi:CRISPR-associated protein Csm5
MKYRVTCLTPTLVGDGQRLAPIDYMVWKEHVNVLDQRRIFRLLAKGPRLDGYLAQLKKADKLDFASWGGFAQNFAGRRISFEHTSSIPVWERAPSQHLFIPTFAANAAGPYLPASAIKGALRTGALFDRFSEGVLRDLASRLGIGGGQEVRLPRNPAARAEEAVLGGAAHNRMRRIAVGDSANVPYSAFKVYLSRTSTLIARGGRYELGWKSARGTAEARRIDDSTPAFAEMAVPGVVFEGAWREQSIQDRHKLFQAANRFAAAQLARHKQYAEWTGLAPLAATLARLEARLAEIAPRAEACLLALGWGGGLLSKVAVADTASPGFRDIAQKISLFQAALRTGQPFPKTRRIVFEAGKAAQTPGWVLLEIFQPQG